MPKSQLVMIFTKHQNFTNSDSNNSLLDSNNSLLDRGRAGN